jgi:hypothetical protein
MFGNRRHPSGDAGRMSPSRGHSPMAAPASLDTEATGSGGAGSGESRAGSRSQARGVSQARPVRPSCIWQYVQAVA